MASISRFNPPLPPEVLNLMVIAVEEVVPKLRHGDGTPFNDRDRSASRQTVLAMIGAMHEVGFLKSVPKLRDPVYEAGLQAMMERHDAAWATNEVLSRAMAGGKRDGKV